MAANTIYLNAASRSAPFLPTFTWNVNVGNNGEQKAEAHAAPGHIWDQRHAQGWDSHTYWQFGSSCSCWPFFDRFHCSWLVSSEKKTRSPQTSAFSVVERRDSTAPHTTHNLKYRQRILCRLLSRLAKNIECSSLADWPTDPIAKTCIKKVWL